MKRNYLFYWFAVLLLLFSPARSYAEVYSGSCGENVNWTLDTETGLLEITGSGEIADYSSGGAPWYNYRSNIKECVIENSVTSIGNYAFYGCTGLTSITISEDVTYIGYRAFYYCEELKTVINYSNLNITKGSSSNGYVAYCANKVINAPIQIDDFLFNESSEGNTLAAYIGNGTAITLPNDYKGESYCIGEYAFFNCTGLTNITIPNSVTSIGIEAFSGCTGLTNITIPESVTSIGDYAFWNCTGLTSITIPNSVTSIGDGAFFNCTGLTSITIPESVTSIGDWAFSGCTSLKTVFNFSNLNITKGSSSYGYVAYFADKVIKADTQIDDFFFEDRTDGNYLIYYIGDETELTLPEKYQGGSYGIGESVFSNYSKLKNITIPNSVTSIGSAAFSGCTGLSNITIPENVTNIGADAFGGCNNLTSIVWNVKSYPDPTSYEESPFYSNIGTIQEITFGENVTSIPKYFCSGMTNLKTVTFPQSLTSIRHYAFEGCTGLTEITLPENVDRIGPNALAGCTNIKIIYCRSQDPPLCGNFALDGIDTWDCTLFVPEGAESLYKAADQWKEFFFIEEITGIDTPKTDNGKNTVYDIYDMNGRTVRKAATTTDGLKAGLYIINGRKVLVK